MNQHQTKMRPPKKSQNGDEATLSRRLEEVQDQFDELTTQAGHIIHNLLREEGSEKYTVISRLCDSITWAQKARWSYEEFAKEGRLGTSTTLREE